MTEILSGIFQIILAIIAFIGGIITSLIGWIASLFT